MFSFTDHPLVEPLDDQGRLCVFYTVGLPGSGKSTWAKAMLAAHPGLVKRANRDDMRAAIDTHESKKNEKFFLTLRDHIVDAALAAGCSVVVDDLNIASRHAVRLAQIAARHGAVAYRVDFTDVETQVCIDRDAHRDRPVGARVIRQLSEALDKHRTSAG